MSLNLPVDRLEVSVLSQRSFAHLGLVRVGDLCALSEGELLAAAYRVAEDDQRVAPMLREVKGLLADLGLGLRAEPAPEPLRVVPDDGPAREGLRYLGSFHCAGTLCFGERRFLEREPDPEAQREATIDLAAEGGPGERVEALALARIEVQPGCWDVYETGSPFRARTLEAWHREARRPQHLRHIGGLLLPDPLVVVLDAEARRDPEALAVVRSRARGVLDPGFCGRLDWDELYEWTTWTEREGGRGPVRRLVIQAGAGE